jgi:hypothetical protein
LCPTELEAARHRDANPLFKAVVVSHRSIKVAILGRLPTRLAALAKALRQAWSAGRGTVIHRRPWALKLGSAALLLAVFLAACRPGQPDGLFENADFAFELEENDYRDCRTGGPLVATSAPDHALTRVGLRWHEDGRQLDFLLELGGVESYPYRTYTWIGIVDGERGFFANNDGSEFAADRMHFGAQLQFGERGMLHHHFWNVSSEGEWRKGAPGVIRFGDEFELSGNQVRVSIPATVFHVTGPNDPNLENFSWHVSTGSEDDASRSDCVGAGVGDPWPVDLEALSMARSD